MIKQFNTAIGSASGSGGAKGGSKGGSAWLWGLLLVGAVYLSYKYIENRNKAVTKPIEQE
jgi:hypothetical protein